MQHLTPVGLSTDGKDLVLVSNSGEEFAVPVDQRFRAALRGDHARLGQLEMKMESALRPRDIQARIRAGESAEDVAAAAQTTVEAIMPFAAPVLAERAHIAQTAQKSSIRRASSEATPAARTLDEASRQHLSSRSVRADDVEWDAWRREDGRWSLIAEYIAGNDLCRAEFTYDQPGRYVLAENQEARLLTGEAALSTEVEPSGRRLSSVPAASYGDELPLGADAIELVRERVEQTEPVTAEQVDPEPADPEPAAHQAAFDELAADHADADWIAPTTAREPAEDAATHVDPESDQQSVVTRTPPAAPAEELPVPEEDAPTRKKGRSSVPSWDEIMFGGGKND